MNKAGVISPGNFFLNLSIFLFLLISPFYYGLFNSNQMMFEAPIMKAILFVAMLLILFAGFVWVSWKQVQMTDLSLLIVWLIPLSFVISLIQVVSVHAATKKIQISILYAVFFVFGYFISKQKQGKGILLALILAPGIILMVFSWFNWFGFYYYPDAVLLGSGARLSGVFQYPNTNAAYLLALMIAVTVLAQNVKIGWKFILLVSLIVPLTTSFLLTFSRGAILVLPFVIFAVLFFNDIRKQVDWLVIFLVGLLSSLIAFDPVYSIWENGSLNGGKVRGILALLSATMISTTIIALWKKLVEPRLNKVLSIVSGRRISRFYIPILCLLALIGASLLVQNQSVISMLPTDIGKRIETIQFREGSALIREAYYQDAINIVRDFLFTGVGGGGWTSLYPSYQAYPYVSNQTHNFLLQLVIETGLIGIGAYLLLLLFIGFLLTKQLLKKKKIHYETLILIYMFLSIFIHSLIDFDMSFVYIAIISFLMLGGLAAQLSQGCEQNKSITLLFEKFRVRKLYPFFLFTVSVALLIYASSHLRAYAYYKQATTNINNSSVQNTIESLDKALNLAGNPTYMSTKGHILIQLYQQTNDENYYDMAVSFLDKYIEKEPYNKELMYQKIILLKMKGNKEIALQYVLKEKEKFPWDISLIESAILLYRDIIFENKMKRDYYLEGVEYIYSSLLEARSVFDSLPQESRKETRDFRVTNNIAFAMGQINYLKKNYNQAANNFHYIVKNGYLNDLSTEVNRELINWYLASLIKNGGEYRNLYDEYISSNPGGKSSIDKLLLNEF